MVAMQLWRCAPTLIDFDRRWKDRRRQPDGSADADTDTPGYQGPRPKAPAPLPHPPLPTYPVPPLLYYTAEEHVAGCRCLAVLPSRK